MLFSIVVCKSVFSIRFISSFLVTSPIEPRSRLAIEKAIYEVIVPTPSLPPPLTHPHFTQSGALAMDFRGEGFKNLFTVYFSQHPRRVLVGRNASDGSELDCQYLNPHLTSGQWPSLCTTFTIL